MNVTSSYYDSGTEEYPLVFKRDEFSRVVKIALPVEDGDEDDERGDASLQQGRDKDGESGNVPAYEERAVVFGWVGAPTEGATEIDEAAYLIGREANNFGVARTRAAEKSIALLKEQQKERAVLVEAMKAADSLEALLEAVVKLDAFDNPQPEPMVKETKAKAKRSTKKG